MFFSLFIIVWKDEWKGINEVGEDMQQGVKVWSGTSLGEDQGSATSLTFTYYVNADSLSMHETE